MSDIFHCPTCGHHINISPGETAGYCPICDKEVHRVEFRKMVFEADSYPNYVQAVPLQQGETIWMRATSNDPAYRVGDLYQVGSCRFDVSQIYYEPRRWWQFWKKKRPLGYLLRYQGGETA